MKKTSSRAFNFSEENQAPKSVKIKKSKSNMVKNFTQSADHNIEKAAKVEYSEKPAEDVKIAQHRLPEENEKIKEDIKKEDKKNAANEMKFKKSVEKMSEMAKKYGVESLVVKSLLEVDASLISDEEYLIFEKSLNEMDEQGFAIFTSMLKSKSEKGLSSAMGSGGDLIAPQMGGEKKRKLVKIKKAFFVQANQ
jgi:hypothetical protein